MSKRVLVTGCSGYVGNALMYALRNTGYEVKGADRNYRPRWVKEVGGCSLSAFRPCQAHRMSVVDLTNYAVVRSILNSFKPDVIIHLASQPSGPYSELSEQHRNYTQRNNIEMLSHLLHASAECKLDPKFICATTTGVPGAPNEPIKEDHMANLAGSSYHLTKGWESSMINLAVRQHKFRIIEMRTSIVCGTRIESHAPEPVSRLDWDFCFGTVLHRFILCKKKGIPITIYGKGNQKKPFITLNDCVKSFIRAIGYEMKEGTHLIANQTTNCISIVDLAKAVSDNIEHIKNPRVEKEDHQMVIENTKFLDILKSLTTNVKSVINEVEEDMSIRMLPENWKNVFSGTK